MHKQFQRKINVVVTSHFYERFVERMNYNGSKEELVESLNKSLPLGLVLRNRSLYFPECNLIVPTGYNKVTKEVISKTLLQNIRKCRGSEEVQIRWIFNDTEENKKLSEEV